MNTHAFEKKLHSLKARFGLQLFVLAAVVCTSWIVTDHANAVYILTGPEDAAIVLNEHEPLLLNDMARALSRIAPAGDYYEHNDFSIRTVNMHDDEPANGHSHIQHLFLGASETVPIHDGAAHLGQWQSLFLVELDHARPRTIFVQAIGAAAPSR